MSTKRNPLFKVPYLHDVFCGTAHRKAHFVGAAVDEYDDANWNLCSDRVRRERIARFVARMIELGWQECEDYQSKKH